MSEHDELYAKAIRLLEDKVEALESLHGNEAVSERKRSSSAFSDEQRRQVDEIVARALVALVASDAFNTAIDLRLRYNAGQQAIRFLLWLAGAFAAGAATVYFKLKG